MQRLLAPLIVAALVLPAAPAEAKEGMRAWLMSSIPRWAAPGTVVHVKWIVRDGEGHSLNAIGVFVRLTSGAAGVEPNEGFAEAGAHPMGEYEADVTVPAGGINRIEFGIAGTASGPNVSPRRSDMMFTVGNLKWTPDAAIPDGRPPADSITNKVTSTSLPTGVILLTTIPLNAPEGTRISVRWRVRAGDGTYEVGSVGMFVRLMGHGDGATTSQAFSAPAGSTEQPYEAEVSAPAGGAFRVEFGKADSGTSRVIPIIEASYTPDEIRPADAPSVLPPREIDRSGQTLALFASIALASLAVVISAHRLRKKAMRSYVHVPLRAWPEETEQGRAEGRSRAEDQ